ncbi:hypothetical protein [Agreia pratensis]|nr:hypothetical protein [Agreia pratensis]
MMNTLAFQTTMIDRGAISLVPLVDGMDLTELIAVFEEELDDSPAGGYGGIVPAYFGFGDLSKYYLGLEDKQWPSPGHVWLLGCDCGEVGCWPLRARVNVTDTTVTWSEFSQPYRKHRDYSRFGPFEFNRAQYESAVRDAVAQLTN